MKSTDKLPWGVPAFFFGLLVLAGIYWYTRNELWIGIGGVGALFAGSYLHRVFKNDSK